MRGAGRRGTRRPDPRREMVPEKDSRPLFLFPDCGRGVVIIQRPCEKAKYPTAEGFYAFTPKRVWWGRERLRHESGTPRTAKCSRQKRLPTPFLVLDGPRVRGKIAPKAFVHVRRLQPAVVVPRPHVAVSPDQDGLDILCAPPWSVADLTCCTRSA